jgi:hypothetical protein
MVSTGLNLKAAEKAGFSPAYTEFEDLQKPAFITEDNHNDGGPQRKIVFCPN